MMERVWLGGVQGRKDIMLAEYGGWYKAAAVDRLIQPQWLTN